MLSLTLRQTNLEDDRRPGTRGKEWWAFFRVRCRPQAGHSAERSIVLVLDSIVDDFDMSSTECFIAIPAEFWDDVDAGDFRFVDVLVLADRWIQEENRNSFAFDFKEKSVHKSQLCSVCNRIFRTSFMNKSIVMKNEGF